VSISFYMDVHVDKAITVGLRQRGVDCLTAQGDGTRRSSDSDILDRATSLGRVVFTYDKDFLSEAVHRQRSGIPFMGVAYGAGFDVNIGQCISDLELIAQCEDPPDWQDRVCDLPL